MDPVCHTLVGAALARSGLARRTALGTVTLLLGANLPDLDVLAYLDGPNADLAFRRGWTHGVLALALLPVGLTAAMLGLDRLIRRLRRATLPSTAVPRQILILSYLSVLTHPALDTLNTYGVRWLMPFSGRWFYGDALFIVDPWVWLALALGAILARPRRARGAFSTRGTRPARFALGLTLAYALAMAASGIAARDIAAREIAELSGAAVESSMAGPVAFDPMIRRVIAVQPGSYRVATFRWARRPHLNPASVQVFPRGRPADPAVAAAEAAPAVRRFLVWTRYPV
ncbi:MAG: metal-dependent hydrolase, partial [Gemmatimonadales bacterium]